MMEIVMLGLVGGLVIGCAFWLIGQTSYQAYRRGYQPIVWALAAIFAMNPIYLFVVLVLVPHRRRLAMRQAFRAELDAKLNGRSPREKPKTDSLTADTQTRFPDRKPNLDVTQTFHGEVNGTGD